MMKKQTEKNEITFEIATKENKSSCYILKLYTTGTSTQSVRAIENIRKICEEHLHGRYILEVIDLYQRPALASGEQIIAAPTLIKHLPLPLRRIIGDMSNIDKVLVGLDLKQKPHDHEKTDGKK